MCGTWTQEEWIEATSTPAESGYTLVATRYNAEGQRALQVESSYGSYYNVYSDDGKDYQYIAGGARAKDTAMHRMNQRGFTLESGPTTTTIAGIDVTSQAGADELDAVKAEMLRAVFQMVGIDLDINTVVEGRTLFEWAKQGQANEAGEEHTHPKRPTEDIADPRTPEQVAYRLSLTRDETLLEQYLAIYGQAMSASSGSLT